MPEGILGDGELRAGKYNMALVRRAIKNGWNIPEHIKESVVAQMAKIVEMSEDERNQIAASKVLVAADANDIRVETAADKEPDQTTININTAVQVNAPIQAAIEREPEYLEWLESRKLEEDRNSGVICLDGEQPVEADAALVTDQHGTGSGGGAGQ